MPGSRRRLQVFQAATAPTCSWARSIRCWRACRKRPRRSSTRRIWSTRRVTTTYRGLRRALRPQGRHRHCRGDDAALHPRLPGRLDGAADRLARVRHPDRAGRTAVSGVNGRKAKAIPGKYLSRTVRQRAGVFRSRRIGEPESRGFSSPTLRLSDSPTHALSSWMIIYPEWPYLARAAVLLDVTDMLTQALRDAGLDREDD